MAKPLARARGRPRRAGVWRRRLLRLALVVLLLPPALLLVFRFVPPPITPLMVIRLVQGEGLDKEWVPLEDLAPALPQAVVASEDNLFCEHLGFDWAALRGEALDWLGGERPRGASTITMQVAKNLFLWPGRSIVRKAFEAWLTPQIELLWPKARIIEVYVNVAEFGPGVYGAESASWVHFGKPSHTLLPREAAQLAAILPNPRAWSPTGEFARERAPVLLRRIDQLGPMLDCVRVGA